jgi:hypothetical protein
MLLRWLFLVLLSGFGMAQSVPVGYGFEEGTQILVFVAPDCAECEALTALKDFPITFVRRREEDERFGRFSSSYGYVPGWRPRTGPRNEGLLAATHKLVLRR